MGLYLSRLERTPDKREVGGSSPLKPIQMAIKLSDIECVPWKPNTEINLILNIQK